MMKALSTRKENTSTVTLVKPVQQVFIPKKFIHVSFGEGVVDAL